MSNDLQKQKDLIQLMAMSCNREDILSLSRSINIQPSDFNSDSISIRQLSERFVTRVFQLHKGNDLTEKFKQRQPYLITMNSLGDRSAERFKNLLNHFLDVFSEIEEKEFEESELFDPIEFEVKMREKAKLNEDIIKTGVTIKSDIVVLRRKAYALDFKGYGTLTQKLAKFYMHNICVMYPVGQYDSSTRFSHLYNTLCSMIPDELYKKDEDIEEKVEGIIYDTISRCLIFNE